MFEDSDYILGDIPLLKASRQPCPVCGHPTGDCTGQEAKKPLRILGAPFDRIKKEPGILVTEDIYEDVFLTDRTKTTVLVAKAGTYISLEKAIEFGLKTP